MAPPPSPSFLLDWRVPYVELLAMISVSLLRASAGLLDGLRLPRSMFRPSPKPIATEGTPIARMREETIAARAEKRKDFMTDVTPGAHSSCAPARSHSVRCQAATARRASWPGSPTRARSDRARCG